MFKKLVVGFTVLIVLTMSALAADTLIYEANFNKNDAKKVKWLPGEGEWEIEKDTMVNYDIMSLDTNIYQELEQFSDGTYIYEYKVTYLESGNEYAPAAGLHFMASDGETANRGDSYLVFQDNNSMQLYRSIAGSMYNVTLVPGFGAVVGDTSVIRTEYNTKTGLIKVYLNDTLVIEFADTDPIMDGIAISFRTNGTVAAYDYVKVWFRK